MWKGTTEGFASGDSTISSGWAPEWGWLIRKKELQRRVCGWCFRFIPSSIWRSAAISRQAGRQGVRHLFIYLCPITKVLIINSIAYQPPISRTKGMEVFLCSCGGFVLIQSKAVYLIQAKVEDWGRHILRMQSWGRTNGLLNFLGILSRDWFDLFSHWSFPRLLTGSLSAWIEV